MKLSEAIPEYNTELLKHKEGRLVMTKHDPLLFALIYLKDHITGLDKEISLSEFHMGLVEYAKSWSKPNPTPRAKENRTAFIAPRSGGKSTWVFLILPMWAAAHGHQQFVAAFSDSATQAEMHLMSFKNELETNELLQADFPDLCSPAMGHYRNRQIANNRHQIIQKNGFIFMARGSDTASLGMKVGSVRPSLIILDDIEPGESNYSDNHVESRRRTLTDDIFMLNEFATVAIVGTTTKQGSIIDQIRMVAELSKSFEGTQAEFREALPVRLRWVIDERIGCQYWPALLDEGSETMRSLWPEKWPLAYLMENRHTRSFAKNMQCRPVSEDADYWSEGDIDVQVLESYGNTIIAVDPAVTTNKKSDYTGIAVVSRGPKATDDIYIRHVEEVKLSPDELRSHVNTLIERYEAKVVIVETNQGGDLWSQLFAGLPAKFRFYRTSIKKEIRASQALDWYQKNKVHHCAFFPAAEEQMKNFPNVMHDDMVDAISSGVNYFMGAGSSLRPSMVNVKWNDNY